MDSINYFTFVFTSHKVTFHLELHMALEWPAFSHDQTFRWSSSHCSGETLYRFTSCVLCLHICDAFATHFSSHQFEIATKGGCEVFIHGIRCTMTFHFNWVVFQLHVANTFNSMSKGVIFQKLHAVGGNFIQFIPFIRAFYAFKSPLFYNHHNCEGNIIVIPFIMGTQ